MTSLVVSSSAAAAHACSVAAAANNSNRSVPHGQRAVLAGARVRPRQSARLVRGTERRGGALGVVSEFSIGKLARVLKEKTSGDLERVFNGTSKTREKLSYMDEVLALWRLDDLEDTLDELEELLLTVDFGPNTAMNVLDVIKEKVEDGKIKTGAEVKAALKEAIVDILKEGAKSNGGEVLNLAPEGTPTILFVVGVNGGGKTTTVGKLAHRFAGEGAKVMMVPGDTFRAAAAEQLQTWAERSGAFMATYSKKDKPGALCYKAVEEAVSMGEGCDIVLADTSGRLHTNMDLMDELTGMKKSIMKSMDGAPHEVLLVLDGTTGLNMLNQAREFNQAVGVTGLILTKLDGTARGGAVVSVVDELKIPVKFVGVGEGLQDLQTFEPVSFVDAIFPEDI